MKNKTEKAVNENMLQKIEDAVLAHLKKHWQGVSEFDIGKDFSSLTKVPAVCVTIEKIDVVEPGEYGMHSLEWNYNLRPTISVYVIFKGVQPDYRRKGIYPMIIAAAGLLLGKDFDLDIDPLENAGPIQEIFNAQLSASGLACFRLDFKTGFDLVFEDDGDAVKLLITANEYMTKNEVFASDIIEH